jgi:hypothetical protein
MKINGILNRETGEIIFSRTVHDFRSDKSGKLHIDGGFEYLKYGFYPNAEFDVVEFDLDVTKKELYDDWNKRIDKYGSTSIKELEEKNIKIKILD